MTIDTFEDVIAWQKARSLYSVLYVKFKNNREYSFKDQLLRAVLSISNNIAEGFDRGTAKELKHFLLIARGSAAEVRSMLLVANDIEIIDNKELNELLSEVMDVSRLLTGFIKSINIRQN